MPEGGHKIQRDHRLPTNLLVVLVVGLLLRLATFSGISLGDDMIYLRQVALHFHDADWPPASTHWATRLAMTQPPLLIAWTLGWGKWIFFVVPILAGLTKVTTVYWFSSQFLDRRVATIAAWIACVFPGDVIFSTHFYPDVIVGFLGGAAILFWIAYLEQEKIRYAWLTGFSLFLAYFTRETVLLDAPIYLVLILAYRRIPWKGIFAVLACIGLAVTGEALLYGVTAGNPLYRFHAVLNQQANPENLTLIDTATAGGNFWTDPLLLLITSHELGIVVAFGLVAAATLLMQIPRPSKKNNQVLFALSLWLLAGFVWLMYGSTVPHRWVTLQRDPRYLLSLAYPASILIAFWISNCRSLQKGISLVAILGTCLFACTLDQAPHMTSAHQRFLQSEFAENTAIEPVEFVGVWWAEGLPESPTFKCLKGGKRSSWGDISKFGEVAIEDADRVLLGLKDSHELYESLQEAGFREAGRFESDVSFGRKAIGKLLGLFPNQQERADAIISGRVIVVMARES